jgi:aryl-alcohol dehydrogenase-like predicted oxidoreductase
MQYPTLPESGLADCYPPEHIEEFLNKSLKNGCLERYDLLQIHTLNDEWADDRWSNMVVLIADSPNKNCSFLD